MAAISSFGLFAPRSAATNAGSISSTIRWERISRCRSPSTGAAIMKNRSDGWPSIAP